MTEKRSWTGNIIAAFAAFLAVNGFNLLYQIRGESTMLSNSVLGMAVFGAFLYLGVRFFASHVSGRLILFSLAGGLLFAAMTAFGFSLNYTDTIWNSYVFPAVLCLTPFFGICTGFGLRGLTRQKPDRAAGAKGEEAGDLKHGASGLSRSPAGWLSGLSDRRFYLLCAGILFLSWVPVLLAAWPGIFSYDSGWQLAAFVDGDVTGHHPILHTALLGVTRMLGHALAGSGQAGNQAGALLYSLVQMLAMAALYAEVCLFLRQRKVPRWLLVGTALFLGFHPVNGLMALCATKDSLFTAVFAVFIVQLFRMAEDKEAFFVSWKRQALFCVNVFFLFALRNNGFHTFLLCAPFLIFVFRRFWKKTLLLILICLGLYGIYNGPVYSALDIEKSDPREMCSVLMQSAARVYNLDYLGLTEEEKEAFLSIIDEEGLESYLSRFADPVKAYFHGEKFAEDPWPFLRAWLSAGMRHKKIYIDSFLANTFGYWYPGNSIEDTENGRDYFEYYCKDFREDVDVEMESKLPALSEFYRRIGNEASFQKIPVVAAAFNLGVYTWLWIFACLLAFYGKQWKRALVLVPFGAYFLTNLLGPVVKMRYHYPFIACAPLLLYLMWTVWKEAGGRESGPENGNLESGRLEGSGPENGTSQTEDVCMDKIAVLVPCYNESKTVKKVVEDFRRVLPEAAVYVYDNNSTDGTAGLAREAGAIVRHEYQQGKGNVIRRMFREIDAEVYLMVDGDDTYPAEAAPEMVRKIVEEQADMVVGDRLSSTYYTENKRPFHNFGNSFVKNCINRFFDTNIQDIMTGYRAFSYQFVKTFPVLSRGFEIETEMSIHAADKHMQVDHVVIDYRDRPEGSVSKLNTFSDGLKVLSRILSLYKNYKPLAFFSLLSGILAVLAVVFLIPILIEYWQTGLVPRFPTLIVCGFVLVAALQSLFAGLVLQSMEQKNKQDFEMRLLQAKDGLERKRTETAAENVE